MAIVQTLPVPLEPAPEATTAPQAPAMGSVSSLISGRPCPGGPAPPRHHGPPGPTFFRQQDGLLRGGYEAQEPLCPAVPPRKAVPGTNFTYVNEDFRTESPPSPSSDLEDAREQRARNAHLRGPPPKLIPVSGKLEKVRTSPSFEGLGGIRGPLEKLKFGDLFIGRSMGSRFTRLGFSSQLYLTQGSHLTFLSLSFCVCKMEVTGQLS